MIEERRRSLDEQARYFDEKVDFDFETNRPHGQSRFYQFLMAYKVHRALELLGKPIKGKRVLVLCCGSGMDAEIIAREGAVVTGLDVSLGALKRARDRAERYGVAYQLVRADAHCLPFGSEDFDFSFVHDGLHHLPDPLRAVEEMARVTRQGVLVVEPADAGLTSLAVRFGAVQAREEAGNVVLRFQPARLSHLLGSLGFGHTRWDRYMVRYGHPPSGWWHMLDRPLPFAIAKGLFLLLSVRVLGRWGNKMTLVAER